MNIVSTHLELVVGPDRDENLSNLDPGSGAMSLAEGASHSSLEPISSGTGQHFVDPQHVERMDSDPGEYSQTWLIN